MTPERRHLRGRRFDRVNVLGDLAAIACMVAFAAVGWAQIQRVSRDEHNRVSDLRGACRQDSQRIAVDVRLDWIYYESERTLATSHASTTTIRRGLALLSVGERQFLTLLLSSEDPSAQVLQIRAKADYDAAYIKSQSVDVRDVRAIPERTPLGSGEVPREWVLKAGFDCSKAYR